MIGANRIKERDEFQAYDNVRFPHPFRRAN